MNSSQIAMEIATKVISDTKFWIAIVGVVSVLVGSILTIFGNIILHKIKEKPQSELDKDRIKILEEMLEDNRFPTKWRKLSTLSSVIGADENETKRLLIVAKARGSEKADGKWGLIKNHPLPSAE